MRKSSPYHAVKNYVIHFSISDTYFFNRPLEIRPNKRMMRRTRIRKYQQKSGMFTKSTVLTHEKSTKLENVKIIVHEWIADDSSKSDIKCFIVL